MNTNKEWALNKLFNFLLVMGLLLAVGCVEFFIEKDVPWAVGFGAASLSVLVCALLFTPYGYAFDQEGVSLCYVILPNERYLWKDVYAIEVDWIDNSANSNIFEFFYASVFCIRGTSVGKLRFYMEGHIRKSFRTKRLLEKYWDGTITGYMFEDVKKWNNKRKAKKQKQVKMHLTDEIAPMEREIRAQVREWIAPFVAQAKLYDLDIRTEYRYITENFEEQKSRPKEGYTYTLIAEISRPDETDEDRILVLSVDLLFVRLGKTAYRGVENKHIQEEIESSMSDVFAQIRKEGLEGLCKAE